MPGVSSTSTLRYCPICHKEAQVFEYVRTRVIPFETGEEIEFYETWSVCQEKHFFMTSAQLDGNFFAYSQAIEKFINK